MCYAGADDPSVVWDVRRVHARKEYACHDCRGPIARGEHHESIGSLHDGQWSTLRLCADCVFMRAWVYAHELVDEGCSPVESMIRVIGGGDIRDEYRRIIRDQNRCGECGCVDLRGCDDFEACVCEVADA